MKETTPTHPLLITVEEAAKILSLSRTMVYELISRESLPVHRFNSAVRISPTELQTWLNERKTL
jgi:excisionase family DNA binding protein